MDAKPQKTAEYGKQLFFINDSRRLQRSLNCPELLARRPDLNQDAIEKYLHNLYRANSDFLYSVSRDAIRNCQTPILVLPDDVPSHPHQTSVDVASLAPNAEVTVFPWTSPPDLMERTINRVRRFIQTHGAAH